MTRTLTALFDQRQDAEAAKARLQAANIDVSRIHIHDQTSAGHSNDQYSSHENRGFWDSVKSAFLPDEDRHTYEEGVRRGGYLLTAEVEEHQADEAVRVLEEANTIDIDQRSSEWRQSGWDYSAPAAGTAAATGSAFAFDRDRDRDAEATTTGATARDTERATDEERVPLVEEQLRIGKREVGRGGVRVRSYVVEQPVHEQVHLRDEHVSVERRPVDLPVSEAGDAFRERTIEMTETHEEAVIAKEARVREEVLVHKEAGERVEDVNETVRHTEVDVDDIARTDRVTGTTGTTGLGTATDRHSDDLTTRRDTDKL